jgi:hypothetical protein
MGQGSMQMDRHQLLLLLVQEMLQVLLQQQCVVQPL